MNVGVISGRYPITEFDSSINHKLYADTYGYTYIHCNWPTQAKNPYLNKIYYVLAYLELFDYVIWIDDDAFFFDFDTDIMQYAPQDQKFISFCKSPSYKPLKTYLSSGQFIVKSNALSKQFFQDILKQDLNKIKTWWTDDLGYFSNGDQDIMVYLLLINNNYIGKCQLFDYQKFNSRFENVFLEDIHKPLVLHFTGKPNIKQENYLRLQIEYKLMPSLVENTILAKFGLPIWQPKQKISYKRRLKQYLKQVLKWS